MRICFKKKRRKMNKMKNLLSNQGKIQENKEVLIERFTYFEIRMRILKSRPLELISWSNYQKGHLLPVNKNY